MVMCNVFCHPSLKAISSLDEPKACARLIYRTKVSVKKNTQGPIGAAQQWKKNVFTSQPNSKKYASYAKNIKDTESDIDRFNDDIWAKAQAEADAQNAMQNQVPKPNNVQQGPILGRDYEEDEVDYDENNFKR